MIIYIQETPGGPQIAQLEALILT